MLLPASKGFLDHSSPHDETAPSRLIHALYAFPANDEASGWEVGARQHAHEVPGGALRIVDEDLDGLTQLPEVVGGYVRAHPDGDTGAAVQEEIGEEAGQDLRLFEPVIEVGNPIHRGLLDIGEELRGR